MMSPTFGMHKLVYLAALTVLIDNYVNRKSEEKLDFLRKDGSMVDTECNDVQTTI